MTSLTEGLTSAIRDLYCTSLRTTDQFWGNFPSLLRPQPVQALARFWSGQVCGDELELPTPLQPTISGGQCPGVQYAVVGQALNNFGNLTQTTRTGTGPFSGFALQGPNPQGNFVLGFVFANGFQAWLTLSPGIAQNSLAVAQAVSITRTDGLPDDCGDVDPVLPDPAPITQNITFTWGDDNQNSLTLPIVFAPVITTFNNELEIPFTIEELNINGRIPIDPEFEPEFDFDFPSPTPDPSGSDDLPDPEPDPTDQNPEEPVDEPDENGDPPILAVFGKVTLTTRTRATGIEQPNGPNIYAPRLGIVRFRTTTGQGSGWSEDIPIKNQDFVVICPFPWGATQAIAVAEPGNAITWGELRGGNPNAPPSLEAREGGVSDRRS